jgi:hypothetical protein
MSNDRPRDRQRPPQGFPLRTAPGLCDVLYDATLPCEVPERGRHLHDRRDTNAWGPWSLS